MTRRQIELPFGGIQRIDRVACDVRQTAFGVRQGARPIGVVEHDVVRIDEVHGQEPRFGVGRQLPSLAAQPATRHGRDYTVVLIAALRVSNDVADADVIREAVGFLSAVKIRVGACNRLTVSNSFVRCHLPLYAV